MIAGARARRLDLLAGVGREPDQRLGAGQLARLGDGHVLLTDVDAIGAAHRDQVGPVVEDEQRSVIGRSAAEGLGERDQLLGGTRGLLA